MPTNNLVQRIIVAAIAIPAVVGVIWLGGWVLAGTLAILGVLGAREIYDFGRRQGIEPLDRTGWLAAAGIPLLAYWAKGSELHWAEPALYLGALWLMVVLVIAMMRRGPTGRPCSGAQRHCSAKKAATCSSRSARKARRSKPGGLAAASPAADGSGIVDCAMNAKCPAPATVPARALGSWATTYAPW